MILAIVIIYLIEWLLSFYFSNTWEIELEIKLFTIAILSNALLIETRRKSLLLRSLLALITLSSWSDFINFYLWQLSGRSINLSFYSFIIFIAWLICTIKRKYPNRIDEINNDNVNILALRPKTTLDVIKALIGMPASSICIVADGYVWAFRRRSGLFEKVKYSENWSDSHIIIDTRVKINDNILDKLNNIVGTKRIPYVKCVWTIRHVLNELGNKYKIKSLFDYIPGVYFMKILKE